jgi:hypothetical protein
MKLNRRADGIEESSLSRLGHALNHAESELPSSRNLIVTLSYIKCFFPSRFETQDPGQLSLLGSRRRLPDHGPLGSEPTETT